MVINFDIQLDGTTYGLYSDDRALEAVERLICGLCFRDEYITRENGYPLHGFVSIVGKNNSQSFAVCFHKSLTNWMTIAAL